MIRFHLTLPPLRFWRIRPFRFLSEGDDMRYALIGIKRRMEMVPYRDLDTGNFVWKNENKIRMVSFYLPPLLIKWYRNNGNYNY